MKGFLAVIAYLALTSPISAQWLTHRTPGIPRTNDGKPNLTAPAPLTADGKPDLSGMWEINAGRYPSNLAVDLKEDEVKPWAAALHRHRRDDLGKDFMVVTCLPYGPWGFISTQDGPLKIVQGPTLIVILYSGLTYRQVFMDGRNLPSDPNPTWMGYSVGRWEGDTLVVDSIGFNDRTWLDWQGHPHTEALRVTERFRRRDVGHMELQVTFEDANTFTRPITVNAVMNLVPDTELLEYVCAENEKSRAHMIGKASDDVVVSVPTAILDRYVGRYELRDANAPDAMPTVMFVTVDGGSLMFQRNGAGQPRPAKAISKTTFVVAGREATFSVDGQGRVRLSIDGQTGVLEK